MTPRLAQLVRCHTDIPRDVDRGEAARGRVELSDIVGLPRRKVDAPKPVARQHAWPMLPVAIDLARDVDGIKRVQLRHRPSCSKVRQDANDDQHQQTEPGVRGEACGLQLRARNLMTANPERDVSSEAESMRNRIIANSHHLLTPLPLLALFEVRRVDRALRTQNQFPSLALHSLQPRSGGNTVWQD